jgi:phage/plasmid-associated DNA primase
MPTRSDGKIPLYKHKNGAYTSEMFKNKGYNECDNGCLMILTKDIIVIDIDDKDYVKIFEEKFPECHSTPTTKTAKGFHYYFRASLESDQAGIKDGARQLKDGVNDLPIDIKTITSSGTGGVISIPPSRNKEWVRKLNDIEMRPVPSSFVEFYKAFKKNKDSKSSSQIKKDDTHASSKDVKDLVEMLSKDRADSYDDWMRVGWCLHNISINNLAIWIRFSKKSAKFSPGTCEQLWADMRDHGLGIGSLHMWARTDNPDSYDEFMNSKVEADIVNCSGTHSSIAEITHKLLKDRYVCVTTDSQLWYRYDGNLWVLDSNAIRLRKEISTTVKNHFVKVQVKLTRQLSTTDDKERLSNIQENIKRIIQLVLKLQDSNFKDALLKAMREEFLDEHFTDRLDSNQNLIAFKNGVWDLDNALFRPSHPSDMCSLSVGYPYDNISRPDIRKKIEEYFCKLHPNKDQRMYVIKTLARQLYGDSGNELFHIHAGYKGSAGNGKTKFFEVLELALGDYIKKFKVELLVTKQRVDANKPSPEYDAFKGRRILYCSEPNADEKLHSGVLKELTGGETITYRMLYSNIQHTYRPQFKLHIMTNDTPKIDGGDEGVKRRIRKLDYVSRFVDADQVDESKHYYMKDLRFTKDFYDKKEYRLEFLKYILSFYDKSYGFEMPDIIKQQCQEYIEDNNVIAAFVDEYLEKSDSDFISLKDIKRIFKDSEYYDAKLNLKSALEKTLNTVCHKQKMINRKNMSYVFMGWKEKRGLMLIEDCGDSDDTRL